MHGGDAVRSCWISFFSVKTQSPSENQWTCRNTRYLCDNSSLSSFSIVCELLRSKLNSFGRDLSSAHCEFPLDAHSFAFSVNFFWSLNPAVQSVWGTRGYNSITQGVVFEAKGLFGLKNRPLHSASEMKTQTNGKVVKEKQSEQTPTFCGF